MIRLAKRMAVVSVAACMILAAVLPWVALNEGKVLARGITVDVTDFGAIGDGVTDDAPAFQAAVDRLEPTGGMLYVPANRAYAIGSKVTIESRYPISIVSHMHPRNMPGAVGDTHAEKAVIRPLNTLTYMFEWTFQSGDTLGDAGGGGVDGLAFVDWIEPGNTPRSIAIDAAVHVLNATYFRIENCTFSWLNGRAIRTGTTVTTTIDNCRVYCCGNSTTPCIDAGDGTNFSGVFITGLYSENNFGDHVTVRDNSIAFIRHAWFEDSGGGGGNTYVDGTDGTVIIDDAIMNSTAAAGGSGPGVPNVILGSPESKIRNVSMDNFPGATTPHVQVLGTGTSCEMDNCTVKSTASQTGMAIEWDGGFGRISNVYMSVAGRLDCASASHCLLSGIYVFHSAAAASTYMIDIGSDNQLVGAKINGNTAAVAHGIRTVNGSVVGAEVINLDGGNGITTTGAFSNVIGCRAHSLDGGTPFVPFAGTTMWGNLGDPGTSHLTKITSILPIGLQDFVQISDGIAPTNATDPSLDDDAGNNAMRLIWTATNSDSIVIPIALPQGFDGTRDVTVTLTVSTDNAGGGGIEAATFTVVSTWDNGATPITDTATDSVPATTLHTVTATIAAADIPDSATRLTLLLAPDTHANDPVHLHDVRVAAATTLTSL